MNGRSTSAFGTATGARSLESAVAAGETIPRGGLGLGLRLGLLTTLVVVGVMAALSGVQLAMEIQAELRGREAQLRASLAPLVADLRTARTRDDATEVFHRFHVSYVGQGHLDHQVAMVDASGRLIMGTRGRVVPGQGEPLTAAVPLVAPAFGAEPVTLVVTEDGSEFALSGRQRWQAWAFHVSVTALLTLALLFVVIRREVTGPIDRLLYGIRKMERGYWDDMPDPGGAREIRWLGWRFRMVGQELNHTVEHLVAAQRRAYAEGRNAQPCVVEDTEGGNPQGSTLAPRHGAPVTLRYLQSQLELLRGATPDAPDTRILARLMLDRHAAEAERLGEPGLRMLIEDAAARVLDPGGFSDISQRIEAESPRLEALVRARAEHLRGALATRQVSVVEIHHRIKHPAGIWKKMREKGLAFAQVHDLVGLRIVTPTEADCYQALGTVHDLYKPIVGRFKDYIARPKANGYRSLHLSVRDPDGAVFEVQIRSLAMHRHAEQGLAAHAEYKAAITVDGDPPTPWRRLLAAFGFRRASKSK